MEPAPVSGARHRVSIALLSAILLATILVYRKVGSFDFVNFDDYEYVLKNHHVWPGITWPGLEWAFWTNGRRFWIPAVWISYMADCQWFGLNAGAQHLTNLAIHLLTSAALFVFLVQSTGRRVCSAFVTALFALHPLHVESVAWIAERKDVLYGCFWYLALAAWMKYARSGRWTWYAAAFLLCLAGMLSKGMMVTIPAVLLIVDFWPLGRRYSNRLLYEKIPFAVLSVAGAVMTTLSQRFLNSGSEPAGMRIENALDVIWIYIGRTLWPSGLSVSYPFPATIPIWQPVLAGVAVLAITALAVRWRRQAPWVFAGWCWYLVTLLPVLGLVQSGMQGSADHFLYVPLEGLFIAIVWSGAEAASRWPRSREILLVAGVAVCVCSAVAASRLTNTWRDTKTLFAHALEVDPGNHLVWILLGGDDQDKGYIEDARAAFGTAVQLRPDSASAHRALGSWYLAEKQENEGVAEYERALKLEPGEAQRWASLGGALFAAGHLDAALVKLRVADSLKPGDPEVHVTMGAVLLGQGATAAGLKEYSRAAALDPFQGSYLRLIGNYWLTQVPNGASEAIAACRRAVAADPLDPASHAMLASALARTAEGQAEALQELRTAKELRPSR